MSTFQHYLVPWSISQVVSIILLILAWKKPVWTRYIFAVTFFAAGIFNWISSMKNPEAYLMYSETAAGFYKYFIDGWFSGHIKLFVPAVATGQIMIGIMMLAGRRWLALGCLGIIIFLIAIAPLGLGSAFPFSITVSIAAYLVYRHWQTRWGSTPAEFDMQLPGDELVSRPDFLATRGITIKAGPEDIFPWIVQIGSKRAGWYSIDWIDNSNIRSADNILPQYQFIEKGQFIPFTPDQKNGMWVHEFEQGKFILWSDNKGRASWCWYLVPGSGGTTRLLTRLRTRYDWKSLWILYYLIYDFGDIVIMSKCMKGIKLRSEAFHRITL
ncbi:MAG: hypothetical protein WCO02_08850 [Bacteroidota bacterium]